MPDSIQDLNSLARHACAAKGIYAPRDLTAEPYVVLPSHYGILPRHCRGVACDPPTQRRRM
jgi:hypothetical protein